MPSLVESLKRHMQGDVRFDPLIRKIYSVDASIYEVEPLGIVIPKDRNDLLTAMRIAADHHTPVIARGAATGITGSCLGKGLIIDTSKYLNQILKVNIEDEYVICEPGVVQDRLNEVLSPFGYRLGPDTSTGNRATIGGMLANNSAGARSLRYGRMVDHVERVELALAGGQVISCSWLDDTQWRQKREQNDHEGRIYKEVFRLSTQYRAAIATHFPKIPRHVSGYNLDTLLNVPPVNLSTLIAGSEGTLGIAAEIQLRIAKKPQHTGLCLIYVHDMIEALLHIDFLLSYHPLSMEMIDDKILAMGRLSPAVRNKLQWLSGNPQAVFVVEFEEQSRKELDQKLAEFVGAVKSRKIGYDCSLLKDKEEMEHVWEVRKAGLGLLLSKRSYNRALAFIEDVSVAPDKLSSFLDQFCSYLKKIKKDAGIYGHIGSGCMHIRPYIDLRSSEDLALMKKIMEDVAEMVLEHGGAMSGEHGDGLIRSWLNERIFGKELYQAFCELKKAFDPHNLMNPGKVVHGPPVAENLRLSPESRQASIPTFLDFTPEGGIELAADLCNGNAQCRKAEGIMCPSFQVSGDEYDTTRARAQSLRAIINGRLPVKELTDQALYDVLDLCIECKGCKRECPSQIDMAKMKSEILYQYQEKHGYFLRNRLFGSIHTINRLAAPFAAAFNRLSKTNLSKSLLKWLGIASQRDLPALAGEKFSSWFAMQQQPPKPLKAVLFNDTYTEYNQPEIGKAAVRVLSSLGYEVILASPFCCGRPLISKGLLRQAQKSARQVVDHLLAFANQSIPIIFLEPSCYSALMEDFKGLLGHNDQALSSVTKAAHSFETFLQYNMKDGLLPLSFVDEKQTILVHGHCHQKAMNIMAASLEVLKSIPGFEVKEIASGCCGVAGSFGYEKEHYDFSMKIGNLHLLPAVRQAPETTLIVASGTSCRSQIEHGSKKRAFHLAEVIANHLNLPPDYA